MYIYILLQANVSQWLKGLKLRMYEKLFELEGYFSGEDVMELKNLTEKDLKAMGITKQGLSLVVYNIDDMIIYIITKLYIYSNFVPNSAIGTYVYFMNFK